MSALPAILIVGSMIGLGIWSQQGSTTAQNDAPAQATEQRLRGTDSVVWKGTVLPALDLEAATMKMRREETSTRFLTRRDTSPTRFDAVRVQSNSPTEDEKSYGSINVGEEEEWKVWGVYDGHAGWATSKVLQHFLTSYVAQAIQQARKLSPTLSPETTDNAIKKGFLDLDDEITADGIMALSDDCDHAEAVSRIAPARAGSCALLAIFDPIKAVVRVACVGDSRAVLGRCNAPDQNKSEEFGKQYSAEALSVDQTGFNEKEVERLSAAHPDEPDILDKSSGRLLGLAVTRAFGDHRWKWPTEKIKECKHKFFGTSARPNYKTPPYLTAEPEITTTKVGEGDFLILASDGLWDHISSEDAVECVSMWIKKKQEKTRKTAGDRPPTAQDITPAVDTSDKGAVKNFDYYYKGTPEHFVVEDKNAATHLVRNALGGSRRGLFCSVMSTQAPDSRNIRDDITVQVIFFGSVV